MKKIAVLIFILSGCAGHSAIQNESAGEKMTEADLESSLTPRASQQTEKPPGHTRKLVCRRDQSHAVKETRLELSKTDLGHWDLVSDEDGVKTYTNKHAEDGIIGFRGEMVMDVPLQKVATVLNSLSLRKEWVDALAEAKIIEGEHSFNRIEYTRASVPWPFQDRDFVFKAKVTVTHEPLSMLVSIHSVQDDREPEQAGVVRGEIHHSYYYLEELTQGLSPATKVVVEIEADPKGAIPTWLVNLTQKRWPRKTLLALQKTAQALKVNASSELNLSAIK